MWETSIVRMSHCMKLPSLQTTAWEISYAQCRRSRVNWHHFSHRSSQSFNLLLHPAVPVSQFPHPSKPTCFWSCQTWWKKMLKLFTWHQKTASPAWPCGRRVSCLILTPSSVSIDWIHVSSLDKVSLYFHVVYLVATLLAIKCWQYNGRSPFYSKAFTKLMTQR